MQQKGDKQIKLLLFDKNEQRICNGIHEYE